MSLRKKKMMAAIQKELAALIMVEAKDPRITRAGLITITQVRMTPDRRSADVLVSFAGGDDGVINDAVDALQKIAGFLRGEIGRRLNLARAPLLRFSHDGSSDFVAYLENLVREKPEP